MSDPILQFENVSFSYGYRPVLDDATFTLNKGESICVVGPNGGGKTTLLKLALGLMSPRKGQIRLLRNTPAKTRRQVGYVPQHINFDAQFPISVEEVVLMGRLGTVSSGKCYGKKDYKAVTHALEIMGLSKEQKIPFYALSGGQRQRVLIARALACTPQMLVLDEPTAHVDANAEKQFRSILDKLAESLTIVTVSHDLGFVSAHVKKVLCVNRKVHIHPTESLTGDFMQKLYGQEMRFVQHGHCEGACNHD